MSEVIAIRDRLGRQLADKDSELAAQRDRIKALEAEVERLVTRHSLRLRKDRDPQVADRRTLKVPAPYRPGKNEPLDIVIAASGSRREAAHWHDGQWFDVLCLRQTAEEYSSFMEGRT